MTTQNKPVSLNNEGHNSKKNQTTTNSSISFPTTNADDWQDGVEETTMCDEGDEAAVEELLKKSSPKSKQQVLVKHDSNTTTNIFKRDGFIGPVDILTSQQATEALAEVQTELDNNGGDAARFKLHLVLPTVAAIVHHPKLVQVAQECLQTSDILLWSSDINSKPPQTKGYFAPHQDSTYAGLSPASKCLTAWIALSDPVGVKEGCLSFYPGSHQQGQIPHQQTAQKADNNNMLSLGQHITKDEIAKLRASPQSVPLRAGQATFHAFHCVHASGPNQSANTSRVGLALRFIASNVQQSKPMKEMVSWIAGRQNEVIIHSHFEFEPRLPIPDPSPDDVAKGRAAQAEAMRRENANYFFER
mmetsp:Transcript_9522/g.13947  ORF Transcript_9522/g.13947 Transcript_9522/m.13947 type:complete len:359 (-) Transcript_9522:82-1158(-)